VGKNGAPLKSKTRKGGNCQPSKKKENCSNTKEDGSPNRWEREEMNESRLEKGKNSAAVERRKSYYIGKAHEVELLKMSEKKRKKTQKEDGHQKGPSEAAERERR